MSTDAVLHAMTAALSDVELDAAHIRLSRAVCEYMSVGRMAPKALGRQHRAVAEVWEARNTPRGAQGAH